MKLSENDIAALRKAREGFLAVDDIPEKASEDLWGFPVPGIRTFLKLEKAGLLVLTEEDPVLLPGDDEPFTFTAYVEMTDEGEAAYRASLSC